MSREAIRTRDSKTEAIYAAIRDGKLLLDITHVEVVDNASTTTQLNLPAWISVENNRLFVSVRGDQYDPSYQVAKALFQHTGERVIQFRGSHHLEIKARVENGFRVVLKGVCPVPGRTSAINTVETLKVAFEWLHFPAEGWDALNGSGKLKTLEQYIPRASDESEPAHVEPRVFKNHFFAILPDVEQLIFNAGTKNTLLHPFHGEKPSSATDCFLGMHGGGEFCLEKRNGDIVVDYRRPVGTGSCEDAARQFQGLLQAIGFMHGCHPWPDYFCHTRDSQILERWITYSEPIQRQPLQPLSVSRLRYPKSVDAHGLLLASAAFFSRDTEESKAYQKALWLMREACRRGIAAQLSVLALCSLLEGLVKPYRGQKPDSRMKGDELEKFQWRDPIEQKLLLPWEWFSPAIESFKAFRNAFAHGFDIEPEAGDRHDIVDAYSRLSSAIYLIMARRMGYSGKMELSMLEDMKIADFSQLKMLP